MYQFYQGRSIGDVFRDHQISRNTLAQLMNDIQVMMLSDYEKYNLGEENLLGNDPRCHHIQIDESKLGKRKYNAGRRVEGVWVLGLVEALIPDNIRDRTYQHRDYTTGVIETRYHFKAGKRIFYTVPNRTAATLLPLIYSSCKRGSVIRSDGWRAYRPLHRAPPLPAHVDNGAQDFDAGGLFFRAHQVVNHSQGFTTNDQVLSNPHVSLTPVSGNIHTNIIESLWRDMKIFIAPRYRTEKDCHRKLLEYLWHTANRGHLIEGMNRCLREVYFVPSDSNDTQSEVSFFTEGEDGESAEAQARRNVREEELLENWVAGRRLRDENVDFLSESEDDSDDEDFLPTRAPPSTASVSSADRRASSRLETATGSMDVRRRVGRPARAVDTTTTTTTTSSTPARRGRPPLRGSRGRGRPRTRVPN